MGRFHRHEDGAEHAHDEDDGHAGGKDHSGYQTGAERVEVLERIFGENDKTAAANRAAFAASGGRAIALINTGNGFGGECHLDAPMVASALPRLPLGELDLVLIENVGNLVCPAEFDVGQDARAMVYAITEGEEKPLKYPVMFRSCELVVVNKMDLLPYLDFDLDGFVGNLREVTPASEFLFVSARTGEGVGAWCDWLRARLQR